MNLTRRHAVLLLVALGACESEAPASEPWMAPPKVGGKADAIATLTGEDIPSDFADDDAENRLQAWRNSSSSTHYFANIYLQLTDRQG